MKVARRFKRYRVYGHQKVSGKTANGSRSEKLHSLGEGGCGFIAPTEEVNFQIQDLVDLKIEADKPVNLRGRVLYLAPHADGLYYGIAFEPLNSDLKPVLEFLEKERLAGRVEMA